METITKESSHDSDDVPSKERTQSLSLKLDAEQTLQAKKIANEINIETLTSADIVQIGFEAEKGLQQTLDGFLSRLDRTSSNQVFLLFDQLEKGVKDANLQEVLRKVQNSKPSLLRRFLGLLKGKSMKQITRETYDGIKDFISGKTQTLAYEVNKIEKDLSRQVHKLNDELGTLDELKASYHEHMIRFGIMAMASEFVLDKARKHLELMERENLTRDNQTLEAKCQYMRQKVQLLESRSLSLIGGYTRLPADHIIIQQIEQAGVATLQETTITASSRFASIKTTLLAINGVFSVKSVQQVGQNQAMMDNQLQQIRSQLTKEIVTTAIASPGDNRLEQVAQIEKIIHDAKEIRALIQSAQRINDEKFGTARSKFEALRNQLSVN